jgi:hypothetical protein
MACLSNLSSQSGVLLLLHLRFFGSTRKPVTGDGASLPRQTAVAPDVNAIGAGKVPRLQCDALVPMHLTSYRDNESWVGGASNVLSKGRFRCPTPNRHLRHLGYL